MFIFLLTVVNGAKKSEWNKELRYASLFAVVGRLRIFSC